MVTKNPSVSSLLLRKLLRSTKENLKQLLAVIAISFLAICLFSGLTANAMNFRNRVDTLYEETNFADIYITTSDKGSLTIDNLKQIEGVEVAEERTYLPITDTDNSNKSLNLIVEDETNTLSTPQVLSGTRGFLVMNEYSKAYKVTVGDTFNFSFNNYFKTSSTQSYLDILSRYVLDGKTNIFNNTTIPLSAKVTGTMYHPEGVQSSSFSSSIAETNYTVLKEALTSAFEENYDVTRVNNLLSVAYSSGLIPYQNFDEVIDYLIASTKNQFLVNALKGKDASSLNETIKDTITDSYPDTKVIISTLSSNLASSLAITQDMDQALKLTYVFPVIFFLVSVLVILTTLSQMIMKERTQIGALKAIGVKKSQIYYHYISYGFFVCFIGGTLGFFIGPVLIPQVMEIKYQLLWDIPYKTPGFFYPLSIIITLALFILAGLVSYLASRSVISEKPVDTLRAKVSTSKTTKISKPNKLTKHISIPTRMAFRNIFKNKVKSLMVVFGTLGCTALLVCGFGIIDTLNYGIDVSYGTQEKVDITVSFTTYSEEDLKTIASLDNIERVESPINYPVSLSSATVLKDTYIHLLDADSSCFHVPYSGTGLTIDETTANDLGIKEGDQIKLVINNVEYEKTVDTVFTTSLLFGIYDSKDYYTDLALSPSNYWITVKDDSLSQQTTETIKEKFPAMTVKSFQDTKDYANQLMSSIASMTNVVKIFAILLSIVVIYNLTSLNISERARDIATMKVLGFNFKEISTTLVTEIMIDTFIGSLIGLAVGYPMCVLVLVVNKTTLLTFLYHINVATYFIAFAISYGTALLVNYLLCLRLKNIKMVESLKSNE
jgi:putative ABC transport system permease protein